MPGESAAMIEYMTLGYDVSTQQCFTHPGWKTLTEFVLDGWRVHSVFVVKNQPWVLLQRAEPSPVSAESVANDIDRIERRLHAIHEFIVSRWGGKCERADID
jgi:hypothetical protein